MGRRCRKHLWNEIRMDLSIKIRSYFDLILVFVLGGKPWQVFFQRFLSSKNETNAMYMSFCAAFGYILAGLPPIMIMKMNKFYFELEWNQTEYSIHLPLEPTSHKLILPCWNVSTMSGMKKWIISIKYN